MSDNLIALAHEAKDVYRKLLNDDGEIDDTFEKRMEASKKEFPKKVDVYYWLIKKELPAKKAMYADESKAFGKIAKTQDNLIKRFRDFVILASTSSDTPVMKGDRYQFKVTERKDKKLEIDDDKLKEFIEIKMKEHKKKRAEFFGQQYHLDDGDRQKVLLDNYFKIEVVTTIIPDKEKIQKALEDHKFIPGCKLVPMYTLTAGPRKDTKTVKKK